MTQPMSAHERFRSPLDLPEIPYDHLLRAAAEQHAITRFFAVPPVILALANTPDLSQMRTVKYLMNAAAPLPQEAARKLSERTGIPIVQGYGLTESSPVTHFSPTAPDLLLLSSAQRP